MKRLDRRALAAGLALVFAVGAMPSAAVATVAHGVEDFSFESFSAEYHLDVDDSGLATTRVVETIVALFPDFDQNRGIIRAIPLRNGEVPLDVRMLSVSDQSGDAVYYQRADNDEFAEFALGTDEYVLGRQTYVLEYELRNTIRHFEDSGGDEFYWDINGTGWAQEFGTVKAEVHLSDELARSLTGASACYQGPMGSTTPCEITRTASGDGFEASAGPLGPYNSMTIAIGFEGGTVVQPELAKDSWIVRIAPLVLTGLILLILVIAIVVRFGVWRDARGRGTIVAQYEPVDDVHVLLAAELLGRANLGLPAQFIDFAVRGMVEVVDHEPGHTGTGSRNRFSLRFRSSDDASPEELRVLVMLFGARLDPGETVRLGSLSAVIGASLYSLGAQTARLAVTEGYRAAPVSRLPRILNRASLLAWLGFIPIWIWAIAMDVLGEGPLRTLTFVTLPVLIATAVILVRPKLLTEKGAAVRDHLLGIREYLLVAEEDRLRFLQSPEGADRTRGRTATAAAVKTDPVSIVKLYERLLPYAVLWGVEEQWAAQLGARYAGEAPAWLDGTTVNSSLLRSFTTASTSSVRPIASSSSSSSWSSSSSSSSSSGSSGGGSSGGGGGGGGGGGR